MTRRDLLKSSALAALYSAAPPGALTNPMKLPDKQSFPFPGTYLNAAYTHPLGVQGQTGAQAFLQTRFNDPIQAGPSHNPRNAAVAAFAGLINAAPAEIAVVPSTLGGENMLCAALGLTTHPQAGVVTDAFHYDASLAMYGELQKQGVPVAVAAPRNQRSGLPYIDLHDLDALIQKDTRLVAISLIGSTTGHQHDLKALCDLAHAKGALVYADIIQAAGAIPLDIKHSGVDFACCSTYKWLMGDFGAAFLYVRPDRLDQLRRTQFGWRSFSSETRPFLPFDLLDPDSPGPAIGSWILGATTASHFEVGTPAWTALAAAIPAVAYLQSLGVENIQAYRQPLIDRLQSELPRLGFLPLTPAPTTGPIVAFAYKGAAAKFNPILDQAKIKIATAEDHIRIAPSVYNDLEDIERLIAALKS